MNKTIFSDKRIEVGRFINYFKDDMFFIRFKVGEESADNYHGWKIKEARKIANILRKIAKKLEAL